MLHLHLVCRASAWSCAQDDYRFIKDSVHFSPAMVKRSSERVAFPSSLHQKAIRAVQFCPSIVSVEQEAPREGAPLQRGPWRVCTDAAQRTRRSTGVE